MIGSTWRSRCLEHLRTVRVRGSVRAFDAQERPTIVTSGASAMDRLTIVPVLTGDPAGQEVGQVGTPGLNPATWGHASRCEGRHDSPTKLRT